MVLGGHCAGRDFRTVKKKDRPPGRLKNSLIVRLLTKRTNSNLGNNRRCIECRFLGSTNVGTGSDRFFCFVEHRGISPIENIAEITPLIAGVFHRTASRSK